MLRLVVVFIRNGLVVAAGGEGGRWPGGACPATAANGVYGWLNIQAASVVIIAEPQWTPAIEEQAIGRCHRMGQVRRVDVHRLLTENSVDQRMLEILRVKADEFNEYARRGDLKNITPDAVDVSGLTAAKEAATQAEKERRIVEMERKRLRMEETEKEGR